MGYLYLVLAALFFSLQFIFSKKYQTLAPGGGACSSGFFMYLQYLWVLVIWTAVYGARVDLSTPQTFLFAGIYMAASALCTLSSLAALNTCKLAVVSLFSLIGGQMLPFFYGLIFTGAGKTTGILSWLGFAALLASCVISLPREKADGERTGKKWRAAFLCMGAFVGNGMVSVATDMNAKAIAAGRSTSEGFMIVNAIFGVLIGLALILSNRRALRPLLSGNGTALPQTDREQASAVSRKLVIAVILCAGAYAVLNGLGNVFSMLCGASEGMQSTVQYPVLNALILIMMPLIGRVVFKEKLTARILISSGLAAIGVLLFMADTLLM